MSDHSTPELVEVRANARAHNVYGKQRAALLGLLFLHLWQQK